MARTPIHPGEILSDELEEIGLTAKKLAEVIDVPPNRLYQLLAGKRNVAADTALRLSQYFGMSADFWMNLQSAYELDLTRQQAGKAAQKLRRFLTKRIADACRYPQIPPTRHIFRARRFSTLDTGCLTACREKCSNAAKHIFRLLSHGSLEKVADLRDYGRVPCTVTWW